MRRMLIVAVLIAVSAVALTDGDSASAGGGCHTDVFSDEATAQVNLEKNCFVPMVTRVQPGDTVTFTSGDLEAHAVTGVANTWGDDREIRKEQSVSYEFDETGVFPYFCYFHPSMVGAIVDGDGGSASAATGKDNVKAVSADAPGGAATEDPQQVVDEESGGGIGTVPVAIGVGVLAAIAGFAGAMIVRRKSATRS
jgi:plastocyanin